MTWSTKNTANISILLLFFIVLYRFLCFFKFVLFLSCSRSSSECCSKIIWINFVLFFFCFFHSYRLLFELLFFLGHNSFKWLLWLCFNFLFVIILYCFILLLSFFFWSSWLWFCTFKFFLLLRSLFWLLTTFLVSTSWFLYFLIRTILSSVCFW